MVGLHSHHLNLTWWENEGYPAHLKAIREFPWSMLEDRMEKSVPNLAEAAMVSQIW